MESRRSVTFADLLNQKKWREFSHYVNEAPALYEREIEGHVREERELLSRLREHPDFKKLKVRKVAELLPHAQDLLLSGKVVAVDGTVAKYRLMSGLRCQIGVVAVNYAGEKIRHSFYISEASVRELPEDALERIAGRVRAEDNLSDMAIRALMLYREREAGLDDHFQQCHVMFHGPLLPFELMSGLGRLNALQTTLEVLRQIIRERRFFSVISSTAFQDYLTFGRAISPGEYLTADSYTLGHHLVTSSGFLGYREKWRADELRTVEEFIRDYAERILIGVVRVGERPYVFHAHQENFDLAAAIIARDSMFQREKGFPLLIDYADTLCSEYFSSGEFKRIMEFQLARRGAFLSEAPEEDLRLK